MEAQSTGPDARGPFVAGPPRFTAILAGLAAAAALTSLHARVAHAAEPAAGVAYTIEITGAQRQLLQALRDASQLVARVAILPATVRGLRRRMDADTETFRQVLRARGYYSGDVEPILDSEASPVRVEMRVQTGPRYRFVSTEVRGVPPEHVDLVSKATLERFGMRVGAAARSVVVLDFEKQLLTELVARGFPFAVVAERDVTVDHATHEMAVRLTIDAGPLARLGDATIVGLVSVEEKYVRRRTAPLRGTVYEPAALDRLRRELLEGGVFTTVRLSHGTALGEDGLLPLIVHVTETKPRTLGAGVKYSSAEGFGAQAFWQHRNVLGGAEQVRITSIYSQILDRTILSYREPDFLHATQSLLLSATADREDTDAFDKQGYALSAGLERKLWPRLTGGIGTGIEQTAVTENTSERDFFLVSFPATLRFDGTDHLLDPSRGSRFSLTITPYVKSVGSELSMIVSRFGASSYLALDAGKRLILAGRATVGSISGADRSSVPADKRFYAGGGDSVRGYDYQLVGDLDDEDDPIGGRSLLQVGGEVRLRVTESIGIVPFVEAANVANSALPDIAERLFVGAGLGLRYYTAVGPLRVDVAVPLDRRGGVDDAFQIYLSLGQAF